MEAGTLVQLMTEAEARRCAEQIRRGMADVRYLLLDFHEREGWRALGYQNWRECAMTEFGYNERYVYYLLDAAKVERNLCTIVQKPESLPESQLRPLAPLEPEAQREVWTKAVETAPEGKITAKHVEQTVVEWKAGNRTERDDPAYKPNKLPPKTTFHQEDDTPKTVTLRVARVVYLMTLGKWMTLEEIAGITGLSVNGAWRLMDRLAGGHHVPVTDDENGRWGILGVDSDDMPY